MKIIESENTHTSVEKTDNKDYGKIIENIDIIGTPFKAVKIDNGEIKGNFIAWGQNRLSDFLTDEEVTKKVNELEKGKCDWNIVGAMAACIAININNENEK